MRILRMKNLIHRKMVCEGALMWCLQVLFLRLICGPRATSLITDVRLAHSFMPRSHSRLILSSRLSSLGLASVVSAGIDWLSMEPLLWPTSSS